MSIFVCAAYAAQPPAKTIEECKKRAASARRRCEIAYYSQCIYESENKDTCKASSIDFDCTQEEKRVYKQELEAMNKESFKTQKR